MTHKPFASSKKAFKPFELVYYDLWTSPVIIVSGYKYYLDVLDVFFSLLISYGHFRCF